MTDEVIKYIDKHYPKLNANFKKKLVNKVSEKVNFVDDIAKNVKAEFIKLAYQDIMDKLTNYFKQNNKHFTKHQIAKLEVIALRLVLHKKSLSEKIYCNPKMNKPKQLIKWMLRVENNKDVTKVINHFAYQVIQQYYTHRLHCQIATYIIIPLLIFATPQIFNDFIMMITGGFAYMVSAGAMLYASHFTTIEAIPRLILSIIGDGIAYGINRKRDNE